MRAAAPCSTQGNRPVPNGGRHPVGWRGKYSVQISRARGARVHGIRPVRRPARGERYLTTMTAFIVG